MKRKTKKVDQKIEFLSNPYVTMFIMVLFITATVILSVIAIQQRRIIIRMEAASAGQINVEPTPDTVDPSAVPQEQQVEKQLNSLDSSDTN